MMKEQKHSQVKKFSICKVCLLAALCAPLCGCDVIYGFLHKPGAEERKVLGEVVFNEYNAEVQKLQELLKVLGYALGRPDGKFGAGTREAVAAFQTEEGLSVTRFVDKATWERLKQYEKSGLIKDRQLKAEEVQKLLKRAGYDPGKADGVMGKRTREAVKAFQADNGLKADGHVGLRTIKALIRISTSAEAADR